MQKIINRVARLAILFIAMLASQEPAQLIRNFVIVEDQADLNRLLEILA